MDVEFENPLAGGQVILTDCIIGLDNLRFTLGSGMGSTPSASISSGGGVLSSSVMSTVLTLLYFLTRWRAHLVTRTGAILPRSGIGLFKLDE